MKLHQFARLLLVSIMAMIALAAPSLVAARETVDLSTLNPVPPDFYTCYANGSGTICRERTTFSYESEDTGIVCGSGATAFTIYDSGSAHEIGTRFYDRDGNLTRRVLHHNWFSSQFSNPLTGAVVPYTQHQKITNALAVPGDFSSATETIVGEIIFKPKHGAPVALVVGRVVIGADGTLEFMAGQDTFMAYFVDGDTSVLEPLCRALE